MPEAPVKQPWYIELHVGSHLATLCMGIVAFFSNGGHLPQTAEGWITFVALAILWTLGVTVSLSGAKKFA